MTKFTVILIKIRPSFRSYVCHTSAEDAKEAITKSLDDLAEHHPSENLSDFVQCFVIHGSRWVKLITLKE